MSQRTQRVAKNIKERLGWMIERRDVKDPRIGFVTFTGVDVSPDLRQATVYFSSIGNRKSREAAREGLNSARGFMRSELGKQLGLKHAPELEFRYDDSVEYGDRISKLLHKIRDKGPADEK